jgi:hypothetical protein
VKSDNDVPCTGGPNLLPPAAEVAADSNLTNVAAEDMTVHPTDDVRTFIAIFTHIHGRLL